MSPVHRSRWLSLRASQATPSSHESLHRGASLISRLLASARRIMTAFVKTIPFNAEPWFACRVPHGRAPCGWQEVLDYSAEIASAGLREVNGSGEFI